MDKELHGQKKKSIKISPEKIILVHATCALGSDDD